MNFMTAFCMIFISSNIELSDFSFAGKYSPSFLGDKLSKEWYSSNLVDLQNNSGSDFVVRISNDILEKSSKIKITNENEFDLDLVVSKEFTNDDMKSFNNFIIRVFPKEEIIIETSKIEKINVLYFISLAKFTCYIYDQLDLESEMSTTQNENKIVMNSCSSGNFDFCSECEIALNIKNTATGEDVRALFRRVYFFKYPTTQPCPGYQKNYKLDIYWPTSSSFPFHRGGEGLSFWTCQPKCKIQSYPTIQPQTGSEYDWRNLDDQSMTTFFDDVLKFGKKGKAICQNQTNCPFGPNDYFLVYLRTF